MMKKYLIGSALTATLLLVGCGSSSDTVDTTAATTGYLVDSAVQNVDYDCITDNDLDKLTGIDGAFTCRNMNQVRFRIGDLVLGEINALPADGYVFPQDLAGVNRENITDARVTAQAQFLQSLDEDNNVSNGIQIPEEVKALLADGNFTATNLNQYLNGASIVPARIRTRTQAQEHLRDTMQDLLGITVSLGTTGYLVDSAVQNVDYDCIADNDLDKITEIDGAFTCRNMNQVRFRIGELVLGEINALPADGYVLPQDLVDVNRTNIMDARVTAMAQLLQSLDEDGNVSNGIQIREEVKALLEDGNFTASNLGLYLEGASIEPAHIRTQTQAREHLRDTLREITTDLNVSTGNGTGVPNGHGDQNGTLLIDVNASPLSTLTQDLKYTIAYMWNEEKLAKDIYLALNAIYPTQQLEKIATQAETKHQALVEELIQKYDLNITNLVDYAENYSEAELRAFAPGEFGIQEIKDLYDALYAKGSQSQQDALEVGCMVEVVDINDLNEDIAIAEDTNASDLVAVFNVLRDGSYSHYWAFDKGLKNLGVTEGCCSLGTIDGVDYCHTEYPQNSHGNR